MRKAGKKYKEIGQALDVCVPRAAQIYHQSEYLIRNKNEWYSGLSSKMEFLFRVVLDLHGRDEVMEAYQSGRLKVGKDGIRNYGWKSHCEVAKWLGLAEPQRPAAKSTKSTKSTKTWVCPQLCPHCGKPIKP
jgi:hypothetical protein